MTVENVTDSPNRLRKRQGREKGPFTVFEIKNLKPQDVPYYLTEQDGFAVRVLPSGAKTFYFKYTFNEKKHQVNLGNFAEKPKKAGEVTLGDAKKKFIEKLGLYQEGKNPNGVSEPEPMPEQDASEPEASFATMTVDELAKVYIEFMEDPEMRADTTAKENARTINTYILPFFKDKKLEKLTDIKKSHAALLIKRVSKKVKANGEKTAGQARAVLKVARAMFNYQIEEEDELFKNPFSKVQNLRRIEPLMKTKKQARSLDEEEIPQLWNTLNSKDGPGSASVVRALMLTLVTGQRPGEVAGMHSREITGDYWVIPAGRIKTRCKRWEDHLVPLTPLAKEIIGNFTGYIFPSPSPGYEDKPITGKALNQLVNEGIIDAAGLVVRPKWLGLPKKWTPNDLRKTARTMLAGLGCPKEIGESILNHAKEEVHGTYDLHEYKEEKINWLTKLSQELERLLAGKMGPVRLSDEGYDVQELKKLVSEMPLSEAAKQLNVSDNAVRKRCKKHNIELKPRGWWLRGKARNW